MPAKVSRRDIVVGSLISVNGIKVRVTEIDWLGLKYEQPKPKKTDGFCNYVMNHGATEANNFFETDCKFGEWPSDDWKHCPKCGKKIRRLNDR